MEFRHDKVLASTEQSEVACVSWLDRFRSGLLALRRDEGGSVLLYVTIFIITLIALISLAIDGPVVERWTLGYLVDVIYLRDMWMHRVDTSRAVGRPLVLTAEHDGVIATRPATTPDAAPSDVA